MERGEGVKAILKGGVTKRVALSREGVAKGFRAAVFPFCILPLPRLNYDRSLTENHIT